MGKKQPRRQSAQFPKVNPKKRTLRKNLRKRQALVKALGPKVDEAYNVFVD